MQLICQLTDAISNGVSPDSFVTFLYDGGMADTKLVESIDIEDDGTLTITLCT